MTVTIRVYEPGWLHELTDEEFDTVVGRAANKANEALNNELAKANKYWRECHERKRSGQTDIYDYV